VCSERPLVINKNTEGKLHCLTGPACAFRDGWKLYYINGIHIAPKPTDQELQEENLEFLAQRTLLRELMKSDEF